MRLPIRLLDNAWIEMTKVANFKELFHKVDQFWSPKIIAQLNDYHFKIAKLKGDFIWHAHDETDEAFIVIEGTLKIEVRVEDSIETIFLQKGEMTVIPAGIAHRPIADEECHALIIEPKETVNTGDADSDRKVEAEWID